MFQRTIVLVLFALVASCSFKVEGQENAAAARFTVTRIGEFAAVMVDTRTGRSWYTVGGETWKPCAGGPVSN